MKVEVGQDALGAWAWMLRWPDGRLAASGEGFPQEIAAAAMAHCVLRAYQEWRISMSRSKPPTTAY